MKKILFYGVLTLLLISLFSGTALAKSDNSNNNPGAQGVPFAAIWDVLNSYEDSVSNFENAISYLQEQIDDFMDFFVEKNVYDTDMGTLESHISDLEARIYYLENNCCGIIPGPVDNDLDGYPSDIDCNDADPSINPGAIEICNGKDDNCDGQVDEGLNCGGTAVCTQFEIESYELCVTNGGDPMSCVNTLGAACSVAVTNLGMCALANGCIDMSAQDFDINAIFSCSQNVCTDEYLIVFGSIPDGIPCDDNNLCTTNTFFVNNVCIGDMIDCNDGLACSIDFCNANAGCQYDYSACSYSDADGDTFFAELDDCNDADASINPAAIEECNGIDDDCDGQIDEDLTQSTICGVGVCSDNQGTITCNAGIWEDDTCDALAGSSPEVCNDIDDDCNGEIDEGLTFDADNDGFTSMDSCLGGGGDCDDSNPSAYPGAVETCDGIDNDCDGEIDEGLTVDADNDGHTTPSSCQGTNDDCDDSNDNVYPGAPETCNGIDDDCDGSVDEGLTFDADNDGYTSMDSCLGGGGDCDDNNPFVYPGAVETCNGVDDDCDGSVDEGLTVDADNDGHTIPGSCQGTKDDCDDSNDNVYPGALEICDGLDNDCDGTADDIFYADKPLCANQLGVCTGSVKTCEGTSGWTACDTTDYSSWASVLGLSYEPVEFLCDGYDNDCNGIIDDTCQIFTCHGIPAFDPIVCSSHGDCVGPDICACKSGWIGAACEIPSN